jgi:hypothetical protein
VDILHINSDFPLQLSGDTSVLHKPGHDPVVITLDFKYPRKFFSRPDKQILYVYTGGFVDFKMGFYEMI